MGQTVVSQWQTADDQSRHSVRLRQTLSVTRCHATPSHSVTQCHILSQSVTQRKTVSRIVTLRRQLRYILSHSIIQRQTVSRGVTLRCHTPLHSVTFCHRVSYSVRSQDLSHIVTQCHAECYVTCGPLTTIYASPIVSTL